MLNLIHSKLSSMYGYAIVSDKRRLRLYKDDLTIVSEKDSIVFYHKGDLLAMFKLDELELILDQFKQRYEK